MEKHFSNLIIYSFSPFKAPVSVHGLSRGLEYRIAVVGRCGDRRTTEKSNPVLLLHTQWEFFTLGGSAEDPHRGLRVK